MNSKQKELDEKIGSIVEKLCKEESYTTVMRQDLRAMPLPSRDELAEIMEMIRSLIFPGYFSSFHVTPSNIKYFTGSLIDRLSVKLNEQIKRGMWFSCSKNDHVRMERCEKYAFDATLAFLDYLPEIREELALDAQAAYEGDPAATDASEAIFCYPSMKAMANYRVAHKLYTSGIPLIPRILTEMAHSETGIDIHPQATIGKKFFMDHGTGVVIGGTCIIGNNVQIYQNVTLGAKNFPLDEQGNPIKGIPRHPIVEDNVVIYSGATILGRIIIGHHSIIGGNVWITDNIPPNSKIFNKRKDS